MAYMKHLGVWEYSTVAEAHAETGRRPYGVRWVDCDKSPNPDAPDLSSRLVAQETRQQLDRSRR
eukprot:669340-Amphidinium_carterae.1